MNRRARRTVGLVAAGLLIPLAACGGGDDSPATTAASGPTTTAEAAASGATIVESPDGLATLTLAPGSLPAGVTIDDVSVDVAFNDSPEEGEPFAGVVLAPDGLVLGESAELVVRLPEPVEGTLMTAHISGDLVEFLPGQVEARDDGEVITTGVDHFSVMQFLFVERAFTSSLTLSDTDVVVNETISGDVELTAGTAPISFWLTFPTDGAGTARSIQLSAPGEPFEFEGTVIFWNQTFSSLWDPQMTSLEMTRTDTGWQASGSSKCIKDNRGRHLFGTTITTDVTLLSVSEPQTRDMLSLLFPDVDPRVAEEPDLATEFQFPLLDMQPGEHITATFSTLSAQRFRCAFASTDGATTSSSSAPGSGDGGTGAAEPGAFDRLSNPKVTLPSIDVSGDDVCGNAEDLAESGADLTAKASSTGGRLDVRAADGASGGLTVVLDPDGNGGATSDDRRTVRNGERDSQELTEIEVGDGEISGDLTWRNHDGCETSLFLVFTGIPNDLTDWFADLPAPGPSDCELVDTSIAENGDTMTFHARVVDRETGEPAPDQFFVITVFGESGGGTYEAVSVDGVLTIQMPIPQGDRSSISVNIRKDAHTLGSFFLS